MRKNNSVPLRSALESFHGIRQHLKDTNQLFESLESKIIEINKETKKKFKKSSLKSSKTSSQKQDDRLAFTFSSSQVDTTAYRSDQKSPHRRFFASNVTSPEYRQPRVFAREELSDYNQRTLSQKNSPSSISRFYHSEIKNLLDEKYKNRDLYQNAREESLVDSMNREEKLRRNRDQIKALEAEIKHREESRGTFIPDERAPEQPRKSANTQELEEFYQLKLREIQSHIAANDSEISRLTTVNQNLKAEMANIKNLLEAESHKNQFEKDCDKIYNGAVETFGSPQLEHDLEIKRRIKLEKYNSQKQADQNDKEDADDIEEKNTIIENQQAAQMNALFKLVSKYQVDMEQIKRDNLSVQEKLQQEILELKEQLQAKPNEKVEAEEEEQHQEEEDEERPSNKRNSTKSLKEKSQATDYFEVMEKEDLAKYAKGLQDTYTALEQQHLEAVEENKRLKQQLIAAHESHVYQHESDLYHNDDIHPHYQESGQSFSRKSLERWDEYQQKLRATPLNSHEYPHKHLSPIKDSSEKDFSKFLIPTPNRKEIPTEFSDLRANLKQSPQKPKPKKTRKSSFEDADELMDQISRVKELVQFKIAQNDAEISDEEDVTYPSKRMCQTADNFGKKSKKKVAEKNR